MNLNVPEVERYSVPKIDLGSSYKWVECQHLRYELFVGSKTCLECRYCEHTETDEFINVECRFNIMEYNHKMNTYNGVTKDEEVITNGYIHFASTDSRMITKELNEIAKAYKLVDIKYSSNSITICEGVDATEYSFIAIVNKKE